ncbi:hypothetical protein glysoja_021288 [Glycine soja]|uniref:Uncharacterized protein n=1 Tax=Glycine max TaxID=3847 RepID=C6SW94_SOYBN|nr:unknown [Glycine max]KHN06742.1 hypothetical protein glysoja_021288 [Glycine soja]
MQSAFNCSTAGNPCLKNVKSVTLTLSKGKQILHTVKCKILPQLLPSAVTVVGSNLENF